MRWMKEMIQLNFICTELITAKTHLFGECVQIGAFVHFGLLLGEQFMRFHFKLFRMRCILTNEWRILIDDAWVFGKFNGMCTRRFSLFPAFRIAAIFVTMCTCFNKTVFKELSYNDHASTNSMLENIQFCGIRLVRFNIASKWKCVDVNSIEWKLIGCSNLCNRCPTECEYTHNSLLAIAISTKLDCQCNHSTLANTSFGTHWTHFVE